jgi:hypothetical protein
VKVFVRFQRKEGLSDAVLRQAVRDAEAGLLEADLGGGLIKQRVARPGAGKRGGYRTIIAYRRRDRAVFLYGFAKNAKADLTPDEREELAEIGAEWLRAGDAMIAAAVADDRLKELEYGAEDEDQA